MSRDVAQDDRVDGRGSVQVEAGGVPFLREQRVVVASSRNDLAGGDVLLLDPPSDLLHEFVDVRDITDRRRV
jgi:hypothetical protein